MLKTNYDDNVSRIMMITVLTELFKERKKFFSNGTYTLFYSHSSIMIQDNVQTQLRLSKTTMYCFLLREDHYRG